jgi:hypothetical protein
MFEEAQLDSPVTTGADGTVTVHPAADHPGVRAQARASSLLLGAVDVHH